MWFGDLVTMRWWDDIWLNEGFATWMASRVLDTWRPELHSGVEQLSWTAHALHEDTLDSARAVRQPVRSTTEALEAFDGITYAKGAALLGMVERWLSPRVFRQGVLDYLEAHRFGNASSGDLFDALGRASGKDVPSVLRVFTEQTGVPLVSVGACKVVAGVPTVHVSQQEYRPLGSAPSAVPKLWQFPVCVHSSGRKSSTESEQSCAILTGREADVPLPGKECPAWIQSNADQAGYYHSMLPAEMVSKLASKSLLPERERVGLLSDAWALVESGELDVPAFMRIAERFRGDPEPAVWEQITSALIRISDELVSESDARAFAEVVRRLLKPEADHLTWDAHPPRDTERDQLRRRLVLSTLGIAGRDEAVLTAARGLADRWLTDPSSIDGDRASIALPLAARGGNAALFDRVVARLRGDGAPADRVIAVSALGAFSSPELVRRGLELVLDGTVRMQDQGYLYSGYFGRSETRRAAFDVVAEHVDAYLARIPSFARRGIAGRIAQACSVPDIERARSLLAQRIASLEGADRGFAQALEEDGRCVAFAANQRPVVAKWLAQRRPREPLRP
jgi:alanyl aminopeptidase